MQIKNITEKDFEMLCTIYKQGIDTGVATFQTELPSWNEWHTSHLLFARIGVFENALLVGWAALTPVSSRCIYNGVAEVSIYVHENFRGKGIGKKLLKELIMQSELNEIWTLQAGIFTENEASVQLHIACGFRVVGIREKIGLKQNVWKDNLTLERRSKTVGV